MRKKTVDARFVAAMEDVLDLYGRELPEDEVMICFDEHPYSLHDHARPPQGPKANLPARVDYEYKRCGTCNIFMAFAPGLGWRRTIVTEDRKALTFADAIAKILEEDFPDKHVHLVCDNLNTHCDASLYKAFPAPRAFALRSRITWHYTPKHGSWLNMAEIEIGVMSNQCLDRRLSSINVVRSELGAWDSSRNEINASVDWTFDNDKARDKLKSLYSAIYLRQDSC